MFNIAGVKSTYSPYITMHKFEFNSPCAAELCDIVFSCGELLTTWIILQTFDLGHWSILFFDAFDIPAIYNRFRF